MAICWSLSILADNLHASYITLSLGLLRNFYRAPSQNLRATCQYWLPSPRRSTLWFHGKVEEMPQQGRVLLTPVAFVLVVAPFVVAHGGPTENMDQEGPQQAEPQSYLRHALYSEWRMAHTVFTALAWVVTMPLAVMLTIARSRYCLPAHFFFHLLNTLGVVSGFVYNARTPDLYPQNCHHGLGWAVTGFGIIWTVLSLYLVYARTHLQGISSISADMMANQRLLQHGASMNMERLSHESEISTLSPSDFRDGSPNASYHKLGFADRGDFEHRRDEERRAFASNGRMDRFISHAIHPLHLLLRQLCALRACKTAYFCQMLLEKTILPLGFAALASGFIVSGGFFRGREIFNGIAHYIKGGIFVWYGILTFGRWMGAFAEFGWAWNIRPQRPLVSRWKTLVPSAEFTESFVIWLYGASNVFLEHLSNTDGKWEARDLEHLSITLLFFGGGLLGMLIESKWARNLANITIQGQKSKDPNTQDTSQFTTDGNELWQEPSTYQLSFNPMPALTILLMGAMMGAHKQESVVSTMLHARWGALFAAFALARSATYVTLYTKPPSSYLPSRPPSEIITSFCLLAGGLLFMNSARDVVQAIESTGLDAMTVFLGSMGLTGVILAWELVLFAIKGRAIKGDIADVSREFGSS